MAALRPSDRWAPRYGDHGSGRPQEARPHTSFHRRSPAAERLSPSAPPGVDKVDLDIGHEDFATMANVARTTAGSILRELEEAGLLELSYRRVRVLLPDALRGRFWRRQDGWLPCRSFQVDLDLADLAAETERSPVEIDERHG